MRAGPSRWTLLRPRWVLLALFTVAISVVMIKLGRWQWRAAIRHHGEIENYSYAFQWWAFTVFAWAMYARIVRDYLRKSGDTLEAEPVAAPIVTQAYVGYVAPASAAVTDDDPERARFNAYLHSLYENDGQPLPAELKTRGTTA